jgi:hypothetical protein
MAISSEVYRQARRDAPIHLQMEIRQRPDFSSRYDAEAVNIRGPIVQVFRDRSGRFGPGDWIGLNIPWVRPQPRGDSLPAMPGPHSFSVTPELLRGAAVIEAYLTVDGESLMVVWDQWTLLGRATSQPANPAEAEGYGLHVADDVTPRDSEPPKRRGLARLWPWR